MWAIVILASLAVLIILVLSVPLDVVFHVDVYDRPKLRMSLAWLFGLVSKEITGGKQKSKEEKDKEKEAVKEKPKSRKKGPGARTITEILRTRGLVGQIRRLLTGILRNPGLKDFMADFRVGLGDPADTGLLFAVIGTAPLFLGSRFRNKVKVRPSFEDEAVLEGSLNGTLRLRPIQLFPPVLRFVFSLPTVRMVKILVLSKWKRKK